MHQKPHIWCIGKKPTRTRPIHQNYLRTDPPPIFSPVAVSAQTQNSRHRVRGLFLNWRAGGWRRPRIRTEISWIPVVIVSGSSVAKASVHDAVASGIPGSGIAAVSSWNRAWVQRHSTQFFGRLAWSLVPRYRTCVHSIPRMLQKTIF